MTTRVYGASDDLFEVEGDVTGEAGALGAARDSSRGKGMIAFCSDGTVLRVVYGDEAGRGIWKLTVLERGPLLERVDVCTDEDADPYSDVAHFRSGLRWVYLAKSAERVT